LPDGDAAPADGTLPDATVETAGRSGFSFYIHVPFCTVRCGYCDFNTYTSLELGEGPGSSRSTYAEAAVQEIRLARRVLGDRDLSVSTVFFGGGTPTLLPPEDLVRIVNVIGDEFGYLDDPEVTTESNPDSVTREGLEELREGGFNRISFGVQSTDVAVLATLDRTHDPARVPLVVEAAKAAGMAQVSLDLIYGTPGESRESWRRSLADAVALEPDHISAYSLIVEPGTAMARKVSRGELPAPDDDELADKYEAADAQLGDAGYEWYEVSNWARTPQARCRHNLAYWQGADWWGVGPGAHSHVGGIRWWNVKHPAAYADRIATWVSPAAAREVLDDETRRVERVLLESRLSTGLLVDVLDPGGRAAVDGLVSDGLVEVTAAGGRLVLTRRGRLLADAVVRALLP